MKNFSSAILFTSIFILCSLYVASIESYAFREMKSTTDELAKTSKDVVVANCVKSEVKKDENTGFIFTYTTFKVNESLKGEYGDEIVLRMLGGTVDNITVKAADLPTFEPNEEVILFLGPKNTMGYPVLQSVSNGLYRISTDETGAKFVDMPVDEQSVNSSDTELRLEGTNKVSLDEFINTITQSM